MNEAKYKFDDFVYWVTSSCYYGKKIPCPMCFGKFKVQIILGDGSQESVECGYCKQGVDSTSGLAQTWEPHAEIKSGAICGIERGCEKWFYKVGYETLDEKYLFSSEAEAIPLRDERLKEETERKELWFRDHFIKAKQTQIWSSGYHKKQIECHDRTIAWHKVRLCMIE